MDDNLHFIMQVFMENAHFKEIRDMLDMVGVRLGQLQTNEEKMQTSAYEVRHFSKKLYFRPGLDQSQDEGNMDTEEAHTSPSNFTTASPSKPSSYSDSPKKFKMSGVPPYPPIKSAHSLVAKHLTPEKWAMLGGLKTKTSGFTLGTIHK